jgi:hypothetical protein
MPSKPSTIARPLATVAFGLMALFGTIGCWKGLQLLRESDADAGAVIVLVLGAVLLAIGIGGGILVRRSLVRLAERARVEAERPRQPWTWREDWVAGRIPGRGRTAALGLLAAALVWSAFTSPVAWLFIRRTDDPNVYAVLFFPFVGVLLLLVAARGMLQSRKFGRSHLVLGTNPGVIGRTLDGHVETSLPAAPPGGVDVGLRCERDRVTGPRKHRSRQITTLWRDDVTWEPAELSPGAAGLRIPICFAIPSDAHPWDDNDPDDSVRWYVSVAAKSRRPCTEESGPCTRARTDCRRRRRRSRRTALRRARRASPGARASLPGPRQGERPGRVLEQGVAPLAPRQQGRRHAVDRPGEHGPPPADVVAGAQAVVFPAIDHGPGPADRRVGRRTRCRQQTRGQLRVGQPTLQPADVVALAGEQRLGCGRGGDGLHRQLEPQGAAQPFERTGPHVAGRAALQPGDPDAAVPLRSARAAWLSASARLVSRSWRPTVV